MYSTVKSTPSLLLGRQFSHFGKVSTYPPAGLFGALTLALRCLKFGDDKQLPLSPPSYGVTKFDIRSLSELIHRYSGLIVKRYPQYFSRNSTNV